MSNTTVKGKQRTVEYWSRHLEEVRLKTTQIIPTKNAYSQYSEEEIADMHYWLRDLTLYSDLLARTLSQPIPPLPRWKAVLNALR